MMVCAGLLRGGSRVAVVPFRPRVANKAEGQVTSQDGFFLITSDFNVFFAHQLPPEVSALPALNPNQPTQSKDPPIIVNETL